MGVYLMRDLALRRAELVGLIYNKAFDRYSSLTARDV
jgi:hypothetical protein